jgi:diguanylate cyclase (GGDEF)-like protein/PAS domain S-box-containing protein
MSISFDLLHSIINAMTEHLAVIDKQGKIVFVNQAWIEFGQKNSNYPITDWIGVDYLSAISSLVAEKDDKYQAFIAGIRNLTNGQRSDHHYEHPCHSSDIEHWFLLSASPLSVNKQYFIVIKHTNITERKIAEERIDRLTRYDGLTKLANRRHFDELFTNEWRRCSQTQSPITLAMIDIDHFKLLNDALGHHAGDDCLKSISSILKQYAQRPNDICARYGGDEFIVMYGNTAMDESLVLSLKIMDAIRKRDIPNPSSPTGPTVTISIGLATAHPKIMSNEEDLIRAADKLLYTAKDSGRDHIEFAEI